MRYLTIPVDIDALDTASFPDPGPENHGQLRIYPSDGSSVSELYVCLQNADQTYSWVEIVSGTP